MENHQVIAENLAASSVPGFRRNQPSFESYLSPMVQNQSQGSANEIPGMQPPMVPQMQVTTDFTPGQLEPDGNPTHLAISGDGFFVVGTPDGSGQGYTRNGSFHVNPQGELVTSEGWTLMTDSGQPLTLPKPGSPFTVNSTGDVSQGKDLIGKITVASFDNAPQQLSPIGDGVFVSTNGTTAGPMPADTALHQGFLESSNVNSVQEMVSMIQAARLYEANQKMLKATDGTMDQIINKLPAR